MDQTNQQTPRTDAALFNHDPKTKVASLEVVGALATVSRQLERENAELRRRLRNVLDYLDPDSLEDQKSDPALRQEAQACFENARAALSAA